MQEHPLLLRHTEPAGGLRRHQHRRGTLVHLIACYQQSRVRITDHPIVFGDGDEFLGAALNTGRRERVSRRHGGERGEQLTHRLPVLAHSQSHPATTRVLQQPVLGRSPNQAVRDGVVVEQPLVAVTAVVELTVNGLRMVRLVGCGGEGPQCGPVLGSDNQHRRSRARRYRRGELGDHVLRSLSAKGFQHRAGRVGTDPASHRTWVVGGTPQRRHLAARDLELPDSDDGVDQCGDCTGGDPGIGQSCHGSLGRQFDR